MMNNLKAKLFEVPTGRINQLDEPYNLGLEFFGWVVDFSPDNVANTALRKEELLDFALFNEGNVYNKLFYKVNTANSVGFFKFSLESLFYEGR